MSGSVSPEVEERLTGEVLPAYLATTRDDRPHVAPLWYRYEDGTVEFVTTGRKLENTRANPRVALAVHKHVSGLPEWSVTLLGTAEIVEDEVETREANRKINDKYGVDLDAWKENTLVRVDVGSASIRRY